MKSKFESKYHSQRPLDYNNKMLIISGLNFNTF